MSTGKRLLIVDDSEIDRNILKNILCRFFEVLEAENGYAALELITKKNERVDGILLDISMPFIDGFNVLEILSQNHVNIPVVLVTAEATAENVQRAVKYDITNFIRKPYDSKVILEKLGNIFGIDCMLSAADAYDEKSSDADETDTYIAKLTSIYNAFLKNIDLNDKHNHRVSKLMEIMLNEYVFGNKIMLDEHDIDIISKAAYFHDIGLMDIPTELICKEESLTYQEREIYNSHTVMGANIIRLNNSESCKFFVKVCSDMCLHHHERYDGRGFPYGLKGTQISIYSQICGIAVRFDALFSKRKEINIIQFDFVINELKIDRGAFSSDIIEHLSMCSRKILKLYKKLKIEEAAIV